MIVYFGGPTKAVLEKRTSVCLDQGACPSEFSRIVESYRCDERKGQPVVGYTNNPYFLDRLEEGTDTLIIVNGNQECEPFIDEEFISSREVLTIGEAVSYRTLDGWFQKM